MMIPIDKQILHGGWTNQPDIWDVSLDGNQHTPSNTKMGCKLIQRSFHELHEPSFIPIDPHKSQWIATHQVLWAGWTTDIRRPWTSVARRGSTSQRLGGVELEKIFMLNKDVYQHVCVELCICMYIYIYKLLLMMMIVTNYCGLVWWS